MKRKLEDVKVEELFEDDSEVDDEDDELQSVDGDSNSGIGDGDATESGDEGEGDVTESGDEGEGDVTESGDEGNAKKLKLDVRDHKKAIEKLAETDPELYQFLKENDENLLNFDEDFSGDSEEEEDGDDNDEEKVHKIPDKLEVASDDSEVEDDLEDYEVSEKKKVKKTKTKKKGKITAKMLKDWYKQLQEPKPISSVIEVMKAFKAAVEQVAGDDASSTYRVHDSQGFNGVLRLCVLDLIPALNRILRVPTDSTSFKPNTSKMWCKISVQMKSYLSLMIKVLSYVSEPELVKSVLKHVLHLVPYYITFPKISKVLLKKLINLWASAEESVRVLSVLAISRITRRIPNEVLPLVIKDMYMTYVKYCKFTSPSTWPCINFMTVSFAEILSLNETLTYQHAFVYIRQLAIHLRNAIAVKKKDAMKPVYNWQFIHCLYLWSHVLSSLHTNPTLQPLIYPLVQVIIGTIKLVPTTKYVPLRFHCIRALLTIVKETNTLIPILPLIVEPLDFVDFRKKHSNISWKRMNFNCALKLSKSQLTEIGFKEALMDNLYELVLSFIATQAHTIAFPELVLPTIIHLKNKLKTCSVPSYSKLIKQLIDKMEENSKFIENKRNTITFALGDTQAVVDWEISTKQENTPLAVYFEQYSKVREREKMLEISQKEQVEESVRPITKTKEKKTKMDDEISKVKELNKKEFSELFAFNDDDEDDGPLLFKKKKVNGNNRK